jgi:type II secretory pathway component PulJ
LIEVLAVVGLVSLVLLVAIDFYLDLSRSTWEAAERTRTTRRAVAILDRVARDLERAYLLKKPPETDPLEWPWVFLAEGGDSTLGAERVKLVSRGHRPASVAALESDVEVVAWVVEETETGGRALFRWSSPQLPEGLDRSFPRGEDEGALLVADGLASFGIRLLSEEGEWKGSWDSSTLAESSQLPTAIDVTLEFADGGDGAEDAEGRSYQRQVLLPLRPLDLETLMAPGGVIGFLARAAREANEEDENGEDRDEEEDEDDFASRGDDEEEDDENCTTIRECLARHPEATAAYQEELGVDPLRLIPSYVVDKCLSRSEVYLQLVDTFEDFQVDLSDCLR